MDLVSIGVCCGFGGDLGGEDVDTGEEAADEGL